MASQLAKSNFFFRVFFFSADFQPGGKPVYWHERRPLAHQATGTDLIRIANRHKFNFFQFMQTKDMYLHFTKKRMG